MYIHPSSPNSDTSLQSEESAAIKIQSGFRGYRVRKQLTGHSHFRNTSNAHQGLNSNWRCQQSAMSQSQSSANNGKTSLAQTELGDSASVEDRCATKIQAGIRGYLVRKKQKAAADAATKIQAGFRGFKVRKEVQKNKKPQPDYLKSKCETNS